MPFPSIYHWQVRVALLSLQYASALEIIYTKEGSIDRKKVDQAPS